MKPPLRITQTQYDQLTAKAINLILDDEPGAEGILRLLERAEVIDEG